MHSERVWRIGEGRIQEMSLPAPPEFLTVPGPDVPCPTGAWKSVNLLPGDEHPDWHEHTLPLIAHVACTVAPWATWWIAPSFSDHATGISWGHADQAVLSSSVPPPDALSLVLHEAWHLAEAYVRPDLLAALDRQLASGPRWPGSYWSDVRERRARAFASWGTYSIEGGRTVVDGPGALLESQLFWKLLSGELGTEVLAGRVPERPSLLSRLRQFGGV